MKVFLVMAYTYTRIWFMFCFTLCKFLFSKNLSTHIFNLILEKYTCADLMFNECLISTRASEKHSATIELKWNYLLLLILPEKIL